MLHLRLGQSLAASQGYSAAATEAAYARAYALAGRDVAMRLRVQLFYGVWVGHFTRAQCALSLQVANSFLAAVESDADDEGRMIAHRTIGASLTILGDLAEAQSHLERSLSTYDPHRHGALVALLGVEPGMAACGPLAWVMCLRGHLDQGAALLAPSAQVDASVTNTNAQAVVHFYSALAASCLRDAVLVQSHAGRLAALADRHRLRLWGGLAKAFLGWAALEQSRHADALLGFEAGLVEIASSDARAWVPYMRAGLALALANCGRVDDARRLIRQAIADTSDGEVRWCEAELWRVLGEVTLFGAAPAADDEAEVAFERAIAAARRRGARLYELRAANSLARLWIRRGRRAAARDLLAPTYGCFAEGPHAADMIEARTLLSDCAQHTGSAA